MFSYRGYSAAGETSGTIEAPDRQTAAQTLSTRGIMPVSLTEEEVKKLRIDNGRDYINGDNPENARLIKEMLQDGN